MRYIDIEDNGCEWDVERPEDTILPPECEVSEWECLPFAVFSVVGILTIVATAFYRLYEFLTA